MFFQSESESESNYLGLVDFTFRADNHYSMHTYGLSICIGYYI